MINIPILRSGEPYVAVETTELVHHATREPIARVSQANSGMIVRDVRRMDDHVLESFASRDLIAIAKQAGVLFQTAALPCGDQQQSFDDYIASLSATTGMPVSYCRTNAAKIVRILDEMETVIAGLTRGMDLAILDRGWGRQDGRTLSWYRAARTFGAVLPSNSPGVHSLWAPATVFKAPVVLKPGREEPWTPLRIIEAYVAAGIPRSAFGFYPTDHAGAGELLRVTDRSMLFGDARTTAAWKDDPRVELHGPGWSKVIIGEDCVEDWPDYIEMIAGSIAANGGRSCINASAVWTPKYGREIADALADRLARVQALPADDPQAQVAAFANTAVAEAIDAQIDAGLRVPGAVDLTRTKRGAGRLVKQGSVAYLLPTIVWIDAATREQESDPAFQAVTPVEEHPLTHREYLFPYASVVEAPIDEIPHAIGSTLVCSAITRDAALISALMNAGHVDRLNIGAIPTYQLSWDQPHEGNLFEHLYRQRAFQSEDAA